MRYVPIMMACLFAHAHAQLIPSGSPKVEFVYGDSSTKHFYGLACEVEVAAIKSANVRGFKNVGLAEAVGFTRGETCTKEIKKPQPTIDWDAAAGISQTAKKAEKPIRLKLIQLTSDVISYVDRDVQVRASITISSRYSGVFEGMEKIAYAFEIRDETSSLTAYMERDARSERLRSILLKEALGKDLVGLVTLRIPKNNYADKNFWDEAIFRAYTDLKIWDD